MARPRKKSNLAAARVKMYRELIFECSERVFAEHGFEDATMQDIAAEAGISLKTLYATFPGKNELFEEIHVVRGLQFFEHMKALMVEDDDPIETLRRSVRGFVDFLLDHLDYFRILLREGQSWGLGLAYEGSEEWREGLSSFADLLRRGMDAGIFHESDPELMAATGMAILQVQLAGRLTRKGEPDRAEVSGAILLQLQRLLCRPEAQTAALRGVG